MVNFRRAKQIIVLLVAPFLIGVPRCYAAAQAPTLVDSTAVSPLKGNFLCAPYDGTMALAEYLGSGSLEDVLEQESTIPVKFSLPREKLLKKQRKAKKRFLATGDKKFRAAARALRKLMKLQSSCLELSAPPSAQPPDPLPPPDPGASPPSDPPACDTPWALLPSGPCVGPGDCSVQESTADPSTLQEIGPFDTYPVDSRINGLSIYLYSQGGGESVSLTVTRSQSWNNHRAVLRVFDPDERLVYWKLQTQQKNQSGQPVAPVEVVQSPTEPPPPAVFSLTKPGIYEVRLATNSNAKISIKLSAGTVWGFSPQNGQFRKSNFGNAATTLYAWIPSHPTLTNRLLLDGAHAGLKLFRETDGEQLSTNALVIPADVPGGGEIWRFELPPGDVKYFQSASGLPLILATTKEHALAFAAAHNVIDTGPLTGYRVAHRFQLELARMLPQLLAEVSLAQINFADIQFASMQNAACKNPVQDDDVYRFDNLLGYGYGVGTLTSAAWALGTASGGTPNQQIDPEAPWLGAMGLTRVGRQVCSVHADCLNGSECAAGLCLTPFNPISDRWDVERELTYEDLATADPSDTIRFRGGISPESLAAHGLAFAAITDTPCNPLRSELVGEEGKRSLIARAALSLAVDLMRIAESELIFGDGADTKTFPTHHLFGLQQILLPKVKAISAAIAEGIPGTACGASVAEVLNATIIAGVRRIIDRQYGDYLVSNGNQHAHAVLIFKQFADLVAHTPVKNLYQSLADGAAMEFASRQSPAGYWEEAQGPDASYIGMTHNLSGHFYRLAEATGGTVPTIFKAALNASYELFNHTVAPEKSGRLQGGFNFNHRIGTGFNREQYNGGKGLIDNVSQAGLWGPVGYGNIAAARAKLAQQVNSFPTHAANILASSGTVPLRFHFFDSTQRDPQALFPFQEDSFTRLFGDEFVVVKTPHYMTSVYVGRPAESVEGEKREWARLVHPEFEDIDPDDDPQNAASMSVYQNTPFTGGGLSMFWTPQFGNAILGGSWSPLVHHGLMVVMNGKRHWENYYSTSFNFQPTDNLLSVFGYLDNTGASYTRTYNFQEDKVVVTLNLLTLSLLSSEGLFENIPLMTCTRNNCNPANGVKNRKTLGATIVDLSGNPLNGQHVLNGVRIVDDEGEGVEVLFNGPQMVQVFPHGMREIHYQDELQIGRVQVVLPNVLTDGQTHQLQYTIAPIIQ
ncbi:MAG: hypothetical protein QY326_05950 [Bdellovibrionota bacterium]|nr:MAG: hypothetical protein QY326_05950 [Bdellovibrionota bacterium]